MRKSEVYARIISAVSMETEIPVEIIEGGGKSTEVVDARHMTVFFLSQYGFYPSQIAPLIHCSRQGAASMLRNFDLRRKQSGKLFEMNLQRICKALENE